MIYFDNNATAPLCSESKQAMIKAMDLCGNPSSIHKCGRSIKALIVEARDKVANFVGASVGEVIFTSGGTESNNMVLKGFPGYHIFTSTIEHPAVYNALMQGSEEIPAHVHLIPVDENGVLDLEALENKMSSVSGPKLVSVMAANNETGVIEPLSKIVEIAKKHDALVHTDAIQFVGKCVFSFAESGVDFMSISAHKIGGPQGVGALIIKEGIDVEAFLHGGGQEKKKRSGTENVLGIVGFGAAAEAQEISKWKEVEELRDFLESSLKSVNPEVCIFSAGAKRLPNTSCLTMPGVAGDMQVIAFDLQGICVSAGSACSSGTVKKSRVLSNMGDDAQVSSAIRVSLGKQTTKQEIETFIEVWKKIYSQFSSQEGVA